MAQLSCQNLTVGYDGRTVLQGLNFEVNPGDYLCILGENGSGKSTLMKTILGLQAPISGTILTGDGLRKNEIGYLPQQTQAQKDFPASVREIVLSGCQGRCGSRPFYSKEEKRLAEENIGKMGIGSLTKRCYRELSGGQQQRVLLARALCASLLGVTLVLKRFSFIGDGLSHVAFGAMAVSGVLGLTNDMPLVMAITIVSAVLLLKTGQNRKIPGRCRCGHDLRRGPGPGLSADESVFHLRQPVRGCVQHPVWIYLDPDPFFGGGVAQCGHVSPGGADLCPVLQ